MQRLPGTTRSLTGPMQATIILLMALFLASVSGCGSSKKEAQSLVKARSASSEQLVKYYDSLVDADTKYIRILSYSTGARLNKAEKKILEQERKAYFIFTLGCLLLV